MKCATPRSSLQGFLLQEGVRLHMCSSDLPVAVISHVASPQANATGPKHRHGAVNNRFNLTNMTFWDPSPLPPSWWQPSRYQLKHKAVAPPSRELSPHEAPACQSSCVVFLKVSEFGRTNNILVAWVHALELTVTHEPLATLVLTSSLRRRSPASSTGVRPSMAGHAWCRTVRRCCPTTQIEISGE